MKRGKSKRPITSISFLENSREEEKNASGQNKMIESPNQVGELNYLMLTLKLPEVI